MGRSQETVGKKEKEKKKAKKKQDKEEKKQERKANNSKGKSLEDMMAYIDEYGNITSTPPDPKRKLVVNHEDIQLGAAKREEEGPPALRTGKVSFFNESKGYGFIIDQNTRESIFVHANGLQTQIKENDIVTFETERGPKGLMAV